MKEEKKVKEKATKQIWIFPSTKRLFDKLQGADRPEMTANEFERLVLEIYQEHRRKEEAGED